MVSGLELDGQGNIYVSGRTQIFEYDDYGGVVIGEAGGVTLKYDPDGSVLWEAQIPSLAGTSIELPVTARGFKKPRIIRMDTTEGSMGYLFDEGHQPFASTRLKGQGDVEIVSYPLDSSGSAFLPKRFKGWTEDPLYFFAWAGYSVPMPVYAVAIASERQLSGGVGTVIQSPGQVTKGIYSFEVRNLLVDVTIQLEPGPNLSGTSLALYHNLPVSLSGYLKGGEGRDPQRLEVRSSPQSTGFEVGLQEQPWGKIFYTILANWQETESWSTEDEAEAP